MALKGAKAKMRISSRNNHQTGVTLTELLVSLAILSFTVSISGVWLQKQLPGLAVRSATATLETDLKQARLRALTSGDEVQITHSETGYTIKELEIVRIFANGIEVKWNAPSPLIILPHTQPSGAQIIISKGQVNGSVMLHPLTGKISSQ